MGRSTRAKAPTVEETPGAGKKFSESDSNPPKLFILPKNVSERARIVTLKNPSTSKSSRYFVCPENGLYEFIKVTAPKSTPRSWLFARPSSDKGPNGDSKSSPEIGETSKYFQSSEIDSSTPLTAGYVSEIPDMFVGTAMDLLFILLPVLSPSATHEKGIKQLFLTLDDHLDALSSPDPHLMWTFRHEAINTLAQQRLKAVCDVVEAGDETMYRLSTTKLLDELLLKARRMVERGLPASLEERFVKQALQKPILIVKSNEGNVPDSSDETKTEESITQAAEDAEKESQTQSTASSATPADSQPSPSPAASTSAPSTAASSSAAAPPAIDAPPSIPTLLRLRTALDFMLASYVAPHVRAAVQAQLASSKAVDFGPLDAHLGALAALRQEAVALRALAANAGRKRALDEDDEVLAAREEKRRRKEEEERRRKSESRGVRDLRKVDVSGMKKLSAFFTKAAAKR